MPRIYEQYTEELQNKFGYLATWVPNTQLRLGDIGFLKRDRFEYYTSLEELGISFKIRYSKEGADLQYSSKGAVEVNFKANGNVSLDQIPAKTDAGISIVFNRANAIMFVGRDCKADYIENLEQLGTSILDRYKAGVWNRDYVIITEIVNAGTATIMISNSANARADFRVSGTSGSQLSLTDIAGNISITSSSGIDTKIIATGALTPLFRASGLRTRFLKGLGFETRGIHDLSTEQQVADHDKHSLVFSDVSYDDFEK